MYRINKNTTKIIVLIIIIIVSGYLHYDNQMSKKRKYYYCKDKSNLTSVIKLAENLKVTSLIPGTIKNSIYILPCGSFHKSRNDVIKYMEKYNNKVFFLTPNNSLIGNKYQLWRTLVNYYGVDGASKITPYSYLMPDDYKKYLKEYSPKVKMIFKTNQQRQEGLYITNSLIPLLMIKKEKFLVAQRFLTNPLLFHNKKITYRLYLLLVTDKNAIYPYVYDDGLIYYTKNNYTQHNNKEFYNIASFYDSKKLYERGYPITFRDFLKTLHKKNSEKILKNSMDKLKGLVESIKKPIFQNVNYKENRCCELFGIDFFVNETYDCRILECNIGPGMKSFNKEDEKLRNDLFKNIINLLEYGNSNKLNII